MLSPAGIAHGELPLGAQKGLVRHGPALEDSVILLDEPRIHAHGQAQHLRGEVRRLPRPQQGRAHDPLDGKAAQAAGGLARLALALGVERQVRPAADAPERVPVRLPVPHRVEDHAPFPPSPLKRAMAASAPPLTMACTASAARRKASNIACRASGGYFPRT